jgi:hypothetical protein
MRHLFLGMSSVLLALALFSSAPEGRAAAAFGDIDVTVESSPGGASFRGYVEYRFSVRNHSSRRAHTVTLLLDSQDGGALRQVSRAVRVGPSSTVGVSLFQPPLPMYGRGAGVLLDGEQQRERVYFNRPDHVVDQYTPLGCVLVSQGVSGDLAQSIAAAYSAQKRYRYARFQPTKSELPVTGWSRNWLGYSRYDGIAVSGPDMKSMPPEVRTAVIQYVECGGSLLILGAWEVPDEWWGRGERTSTGLDTYYVKFGEVLIDSRGDKADAARLSYEEWQRVHQAWSKTQQAMQGFGNVEAANEAFPVIESFRVPVRGMFILVLAFAVVLGPVNLIVLSRKKRRIWLLWTVPLISVVTCLAVSAYALFAEGFGAYVRTGGFTILDEGSHRATTIGMTAFYSPLTPGEGLHFGYETELVPQIELSGLYNGKGNRTVDWTNDQHLARGWVTARVPAHFMVRKSEVRRERLVLREGNDGSLSVVNGLGADIRQLWLADREGKIHTARNIRAGAEADLVASGASWARQASENRDVLRGILASGWIDGVRRVTADPEQFLSPECYIALLDGNPFIEQGLKKARPRRCGSLVYGIMKREADES